MGNDPRSIDLVCLGEPMAEFNQTVDGVFVQGIGGDTSNCAVSAARQGTDVGYISRIGADHFGDSLIRLWQNEGIDVSQVTRSEQSPTGIYFVTHDDDGHHFTYYRQHSAASKMMPDDLNEAGIANASILHVSAISQAISDSAAETVLAAIEIANRNGTVVSYDTNLRLNLWSLEKAKKAVNAAMNQCQIALPSYDDALKLSGESDPDRIVDFYLDLGAQTVVLKMGEKGVKLDDRGKRIDVAGLQVDSIDANAAGDTFAGAFLSQYLRCGNAADAAQYANAAAALSTCRSGAVSSIPNRSEVEKMLSEFE